MRTSGVEEYKVLGLGRFWTIRSIFGLYIEAGEQRKTTKFGRQVFLSFPPQSSKFRVLQHFADVIARRHSQAVA